MEKCKYCGNDLFRWEKSGPHNKLLCGSCGKYQQFVNLSSLEDSDGYASIEQEQYAINLTRIFKKSGKRMSRSQAGAIIKAFKEK